MAPIPPVAKIQQDILWRVFSLIAGSRGTSSEEGKETYEEKIKDHPLTSIRRVSQVCFAWRQLAIESPSLWGQMIDVDVMGKVSECWRSEIMARTKEAPLFVYGEVDGHHKVTRNFFTALLLNDWFRIADFLVSVLSAELFDHQVWATFWEQPSTHLTQFAISLRHGSLLESVSINQKGATLFKNCAPALRTYHADQFYVGPQASWTANLRSMTLCSHLSAPQVLDMLSYLPLLENLRILNGSYHLPAVHDSNPSHVAGPLRRITMPNLRWLYIYASLEKLLPILSHISLPVRKICSVTAISADLSDSIINLEDVESFMPVLASYTQLNLMSYMMSSLGIVLSDSGLFSIVYGDPAGQDLSEDPSTMTSSILTIFHNIRLRKRFHSLLIKSIITCNLSRVKKLILTTSYSSKAVDPTDLNFKTFLVSLTGLETLIATESSIELLDKVDSGPIFPSLRTLELDVWSKKKVSPNFSSSLKLFFNRRIDAGTPVTVLNISKFVTELAKVVDWSFLEAVNGLKVIWSNKGHPKEYICGTGSPETIET